MAAEFSVTHELDATPDRAFAFVSDPANDPRWRSGVRSAVLISGSPLARGARYLVTGTPMGPRATVEVVLEEVDPPLRLVFSTILEKFSLTQTVEFRSLAGGRSEATFSAAIDANAAVAAVLRRTLASGYRKDLGRLDAALRGDG